MKNVVLFHTHGLGRFDFSNLAGHDLHEVDRIAAERSAYLCPAVFLKQSKVRDFRDMLTAFNHHKADGQLSRILGFSIEGPILGSRGGVPTGSVWSPTSAQWQEITSWFGMGLKYIVVSPDMFSLSEEMDRGFTFADFLSQIYSAGGRIALGHFSGSSPTRSASRIYELLTFLESLYFGSPYLVLTDHLFNDMPRNFRHAFRTSAELILHDGEITKWLEHEWSASQLSDLLGPVPAALIEAGKNGRLTLSLNFDGGHVDLNICRRVVDYLGTSRVIAMTDHVEVNELADEPLSKQDGTDLLYRSDGVLAASSVGHERQRQNMSLIGLDDAAIDEIFYSTPLAALNFRPIRRTNK